MQQRFFFSFFFLLHARAWTEIASGAVAHHALITTTLFLEWDNVTAPERTLWQQTRAEAAGGSSASGDGWVTDEDRRVPLRNADTRSPTWRKAERMTALGRVDALEGRVENGCATMRREVPSEAMGHFEMTLRLTTSLMTKRVSVTFRIEIVQYHISFGRIGREVWFFQSHLPKCLFWPRGEITSHGCVFWSSSLCERALINWNFNN